MGTTKWPAKSVDRKRSVSRKKKGPATRLAQVFEREDAQPIWYNSGSRDQLLQRASSGCPFSFNKDYDPPAERLSQAFHRIVIFLLSRNRRPCHPSPHRGTRLARVARAPTPATVADAKTRIHHHKPRTGALGCPGRTPCRSITGVILSAVCRLRSKQQQAKDPCIVGAPRSLGSVYSPRSPVHAHSLNRADHKRDYPAPANRIPGRKDSYGPWANHSQPAAADPG